MALGHGHSPSRHSLKRVQSKTAAHQFPCWHIDHPFVAECPSMICWRRSPATWIRDVVDRLYVQY